MPDFVKDAESRMKKTVDVLRDNLSKVRTGRANPAILSDIKVEAYETVLPIQQVATLSSPDPRTILIKAFDRNVAPAIEKAILKANLGFNPNRDGDTIKIFLPPMTDETRHSIVKLVKKEIEDSKIAVRNVRHEARKKIETAQKNREISEDDLHKQEAQMQKDTDRFIAEMDALYVRKEKEILEG